ncbi:3'(2'),5'-bisphosphate nucleotidase CysQ [Fulvivirga sediminis]|uniref:3'(2'),5'-bisphosphate nucleotidase CysQ n=1 Tax=Fulvivirga sediminis TaxID=2803949 RepID=A0A937F210_9BACT|nr:3'(2'),5'-bisphosphate nucleotidase CysQ [Fulvivirga sediminis]MBL3654842.1 3'(2'),5'-bisphosphate nucleotidase CysQ [Fulvivirga sediminis]
MTEQINTQELIDLALQAGQAILNIYHDKDLAGDVDYKSDNSPLTLADKASHAVIMKGLTKLHPNIPIISEEGEQVEYSTRKNYDTFWLIDPLDGTKEFINRNGEFTVNIALISKQKPVFGIVYAPVPDVVYVGTGERAFKLVNGKEEPLQVNNSTSKRIAVRSKSHASPEEEVILKEYDVIDSISVGSSLKFCMVAEGKADIYYRHGPTMEWDTAAGQAVLESAGGKVFKETGPVPFTYNKESLLNTGFLGIGF